MKNYIVYAAVVTFFLNTATLYTQEDTNQAANPQAALLTLVQNGIDTLLTKPDKGTRWAPYEFSYTNKDVNFDGTIELKKLTINATQTEVNIAMVSIDDASEDVRFVGLFDGPEIRLNSENGYPIFINVYQNTEFRRLPDHTFRIKANSTNTYYGAVIWTMYYNQRILFAPIGYKCGGSVTLPEDPTTNIVSGEFVDTNVILNGTCLISGPVFIVADYEDVTVTLDVNSVLMNQGNGEYEDALIILANEGRKVTIIVNETLQWRSHLNLPFCVVQGGPGEIEIQIVAQPEPV